jgi:hypothetical protein
MMRGAAKALEADARPACTDSMKASITMTTNGEYHLKRFPISKFLPPISSLAIPE